MVRRSEMAADSRTVRNGAVPGHSGAHGSQERPARGKQAPVKKTKEPHKWWIFYWGGSIDIPMLVITLVLLVLGITMMFSASHALSYRDNQGDSYQYATKQVGFAVGGLIMMFVLSFVDYRILMHEWHPTWFGKRRTVSLAHVLLVLSMGLTALVIPFGVRNIEGGPKRWLPVPGLGTFQPSDVLKVGLIIYLSYYIAVNYKQMRHFVTGIVKPFLRPRCPAYGAAAFLSGSHHGSYHGVHAVYRRYQYQVCSHGAGSRRCFASAGSAVLGLHLLLGQNSQYFRPPRRPFKGYLPDVSGSACGLWGKGFDNSTQKYYYLPEAQNDFVYAVCCEEFGFIGGVVIILLFLIFVFRGFYIGRKSDDRLGLMLATGISLQVGLQAFLNIGVNVSAAPNTGISMPFFSYGGTALFMLLCEIGVMLSISRRAKLS